MDLTLRYDTPAEEWVEALPIGNGRLGAMVFGRTATERVQFNEDTVWAGGPHDYAHEDAAAHLPEIRRLLREGKQREAEELEVSLERLQTEVAVHPKKDEGGAVFWCD